MSLFFFFFFFFKKAGKVVLVYLTMLNSMSVSVEQPPGFKITELCVGVVQCIQKFFSQTLFDFKRMVLDFPQIFRKDSLCPQQAPNLFFGVQR